MKALNQIKKLAGGVLILLVSQASLAQTYNLNNNSSSLKVDGTSNIHDWTVEAKDQQGVLIVDLDNNNLVKVNKLEFNVAAESLESGKNGMDKNTYKALKTDKYKQITYKMNKVNSIECNTPGNCKVNTSGTLTIAGTTKPINITFDAKVTGDKITLTGNKQIRMTEFKVDPPTAVLGTIKTGDQVNVKFQTTFIK